MPVINIDEVAFGGLPDDMKSLAKKSEDGRFAIDVVDASFREKNVGLVKERDTLAQSYNGILEIFGGEKDPAKLKAAWDELHGLRKKVSDKELIDNTSFEKALETRTKEMATSHEQQINSFQKTIAETNARIEQLQKEGDANELRYHIQLLLSNPNSEFNPLATPDIVNRANAVWKKNKEGKWVATNGSELLYDEAANPLTFESWMKKLGIEAPYYLKQSAGGGAGGGRGGAGAQTSSMEGMSNMSFEEYEKMRNAEQLKQMGRR